MIDNRENDDVDMSGAIKFYREGRYGFICPEDGSADVYFSKDHVACSENVLRKGTIVRFKRAANELSASFVDVATNVETPEKTVGIVSKVFPHFGYIKPTKGGVDVYFRIDRCVGKEGNWRPVKGNVVEYEPYEYDGRPRAKEVQFVE